MADDTKYGLTQKTLEKIIKMFKKFPEIEQCVLYGSRAIGNFKNGSDIDIVLKGEKLNLSILNRIELMLDDLLLPYTFDLSAIQYINNPDLIEHINRIGKILYP